MSKKKQIKSVTDPLSVNQSLTVCGGVCAPGAPCHRSMDAAAGLKFVIGLPSSDTTVTENTEQTHTAALSLSRKTVKRLHAEKEKLPKQRKKYI